MSHVIVSLAVKLDADNQRSGRGDLAGLRKVLILRNSMIVASFALSLGTVSDGPAAVLAATVSTTAASMTATAGQVLNTAKSNVTIKPPPAPPPAPASTRVATPATVEKVLNGAKPGDTITLAAGNYTAIDVRHRQWNPPITVDATAARLRGIKLWDVAGVTWHGGAFDGGDAVRGAFDLTESSQITVDGTTMSHFTRYTIGLQNSSDIRLTNNSFTDMGSDGIDIALSRRVFVDHNVCAASHPTPDAHPDCIQMWSRPTITPTADITITNNTATGMTQGFTGFNHVRPNAAGKDIDDGGFDRIVIENNTAKVGYYHGISLYTCRKCIIRNNRVETMPNPDNPRVHAWIMYVDSPDMIACGNTVASAPGGPETKRCK